MDKVMYFGPFILPEGNAATQRAQNLKKIFSEYGLNLVLCGVSNDITNSNYKSIGENYVRKKRSNLIEYLCAMKEILLINQNKTIKMVFLYNMPALKLIQIYMYCKIRKIKIVQDITEWYSPSKGKSVNSILKNLDTLLRMNLMIRKNHNIIFISNPLEKMYKKLSNSIVLPSFVDDLYLSNFVDTEKLKGEKKIISYIGNPGKYCEKERVDLLITAICELNMEGKNFEFHIAGISREELEKNYPHLCRLDSYETSIIFHGYLSRTSALSLMKGSDLTTIIRDRTIANEMGFPTKLAESLFLQVPVFITNVGEMKNYVIDGFNGYVLDISDRVDYMNLKEKLIKIFNSDIKFKEIDTVFNLYISKTNVCYRKNILNFLKDV